MFKSFFAAIREYRQVRQLSLFAETANFWNEEDQMHLLRFMTSTAGQKLKARLNNMIYKAMVQACSVDSTWKHSGEYMRGLACGVGTTIQAIDAHLPVKVEEKDFSESHAVNRDTSELDHLPTR